MAVNIFEIIGVFALTWNYTCDVLHKNVPCGEKKNCRRLTNCNNKKCFHTFLEDFTEHLLFTTKNVLTQRITYTVSSKSSTLHLYENIFCISYQVLSSISQSKSKHFNFVYLFFNLIGGSMRVKAKVKSSIPQKNRFRKHIEPLIISMILYQCSINSYCIQLNSNIRL